MNNAFRIPDLYMMTMLMSAVQDNGNEEHQSLTLYYNKKALLPYTLRRNGSI